MRKFVIIASMISLSSGCFAQSAVLAEPNSNTTAVSGQLILRAGTQVQLRLLETLTTKNKALRDGQRVRLEVAETVFVDGVNVVPVGTPALAEVTDVRNKGMWGKSGRFLLRILYMNVNGKMVRISGNTDDKGTAGGAGAVAVSAIVFLPAGFFMTGTSANLPAGTAVRAFVDEDVSFETSVSRPILGASAPAAAQLNSASVRPGVAVAQGQVVVTPVIGPTKRQANTPSGYCLDVPRGYAGLGTQSKPAITTFAPACWQLDQ